MSHTAILRYVRAALSERVVVDQADEVIWIDPQVLIEARDPARPHIPGAPEIDGDLLHFGTAGAGLGRLTYRLRSDRVYTVSGPEHWLVADRVREDRP